MAASTEALTARWSPCHAETAWTDLDRLSQRETGREKRL